jgi:DNA-binding MarR family transcriptional regulator
MEKDHVDRWLAAAGIRATEGSVVEVVARLHRTLSFVDERLNRAFAELDLKQGEAEVLMALSLGTGKPQSPTGVASQLLCSTGAMTNRLDRLERSDLIKRQHDTKDRRSILLSITPKGRTLARRAMDARDRLEDELIPGLSRDERRSLVRLLRKMLLSFEFVRATAP